MATPPGPSALALGTALRLAVDPLAGLTRLARDYGDVVRFRVGRRPAVLINDPALIDRVVRDHRFVRSMHTRRSLSELLGPGLLTLEGRAHLAHRRAMQPAFHRERMQRYVAIMAEETSRVLAEWRPGERELRADLMRLTLSIVARALFGVDTRRDAERIERALADVLPAVLRAAMISSVWLEDAPQLHGPGTRRAIATLRELVRAIVAHGSAQGDDLLSLLIANLEPEEVSGEILTTLLAGHDTTAHTLSWAFWLLCAHPELQERVAAEVQGVSGGRALTADDLPRLALVDRVLRETLRLYPAAWWMDRVRDEPSELGGFDIPANTMVVQSAYVTQRDARYFPDPLRFDPERFLPERAARIPEGAYLPFSAGVHACIGSGFAMLEAKLILGSVLQKFSLTALRPDAVRAKPLITLGMTGRLDVSVQSRPG